MAKIDKLDLRKKKAELEGAANQQVHVRVSEQALRRSEQDSRQSEAEEEDTWRDLKKNEEELGPGEIRPSHSFLDKVGERFAKLKSDGGDLKVRERREEEPAREVISRSSHSGYEEEPERDVAVRSSRRREEEPEREVAIRIPRRREVDSERETATRIPRRRVGEPEREAAVRSSVREEVAAEAEPQIEEPGETLNLRPRPERRARKAAPIERLEHTKSFEEKIAERTSLRIQAERPEAETETARPEVFESDSMHSYRRSAMSNGLKLITAPIEGTKTVTALLMYGTGAKYESLSVNGLSHFLEHMFFKGTKKRPNAQKLSSDLDALGCEYNAFTAKEYTGYWIKVDSSKIGAAMEILSDMLLNSEFSTADINKERGVIIEEINMYHENPMMYIEDVFESCLYGDTPAGREIAGPKSNINAFKRQNFLNYFSSQYGANSAVLCLAGDIDERTERLAEKYFGKMPRAAFKEKLRTPDAQRAPAVRIHYKEGNQAIISLGVRAYDTFHEDKIILKLLAVILGGSMSSRMFTEVREKRGLAYSVHTAAECYTDTGYLTTQAGIPVGKEEEAIKVILAQYKKIRTALVSAEELKRAKDLIRGRTIIGFEASDNVANWYGLKAVLKENLSTPEEYFAKLAKVKAEDVRRVAKDIFKDEKLNLAVIGPFQQEEDFEAILKL